MANIFKRVGYATGGGGGSGNVQAPVADPGSLPLTGNTVDDLRYVISEENFYRWTGTEWVPQQAVAGKYLANFIIASWTLSAGEYVIEYPKTLHSKGDNPIVQVFELELGQYSPVIMTVEVTNIGLVRLRIPQTPDLRFEGKVIIA